MTADKAEKWLAWLRSTQPVRAPRVRRVRPLQSRSGHCEECDTKLDGHDWTQIRALDPNEPKLCIACREEVEEEEPLWFDEISGEVWDDVAPEGLGAELFHPGDFDEIDRYDFDQ